MSSFPEGDAICYCEGAFNTTDGKTTHGLVRFTRRYNVKAVIDSTLAGHDSGQWLDRRPNGIPIVATLEEAMKLTDASKPRFFVVGIAVVGGRLAGKHRGAVVKAIEAGLNVDCGLHEFLTEDKEFSELARKHKVQLRDVRKTPPRKELHAFSGKIEQVDSLKIAALGTDSAIGKRTTAWKIVQGFEEAGISAEMIGTGQTGWMQGARYSILLDSLINDFVAGELEHAVWSAWNEQHPQAIIVEGQGGLLNPAFPGGFEILAATKPDVILLQHAPARKTYEDFPAYPIHSIAHQIKALEMISSKPVVAITLNHGGLKPEEIPAACEAITKDTGLPCVDVLVEGPAKIIEVLKKYLKKPAAA